jgi:ribose 5-phosphate isomerase B
VRIAFGTDEDTDLTRSVVAELERLGHRVVAVAAGAPWPEVGRGVGEAVAAARADRGVVCCWTGTGVSID